MAFYIHDRPVVGQSYYFGREILVRSLVEGLERGRAFALVGGPKTGRSSTLLQVEAKLKERWRREPEATKTVPVYVDLRALRELPAAELARHLWTAMTAQVVSGDVIGKGAAPKLGNVSFQRVRDPWQVFLDACAELAGKISGTGAFCHHVYLLDGADELLERRRERELAVVAAMARREVAGGPHGVVLAGGRRLRDSLLEHEAPLSKLRLLMLGALRDSEAVALIKGGLPDMPADRVDALLRQSGRQPWLLQRLLFELEHQTGDFDVEAACAAAHHEIGELCTAIWREFDLDRGLTYRGAYAAPEHALLQLMLDYGNAVDLRTAEIQLGIKPLKEFAEFLEYVGVAERVLRGDLPLLRPHFELWNRWYGARILE